LYYRGKYVPKACQGEVSERAAYRNVIPKHKRKRGICPEVEIHRWQGIPHLGHFLTDFDHCAGLASFAFSQEY
jgi:hypothetical protein